MRNDGKTYFTDRGVNGWNEYGYGIPPISHNATYISVAASEPPDAWVLREDGNVYHTTDNGGNWISFGDAGTDNSWVSLAASTSYLYALKNDGMVMRTSISSAIWGSWGDTGVQIIPGGIAVDLGGNLYAIRADGAVVYATESSSTWSSKGDAGSDSSWVDIGAFDSPGNVYAMRNDRSIARSTTGTSSTWNTWSTAGSDTSWVAIETNGTHVFALKNDGIIDRSTTGATPNWDSPFSDIGTGNAFLDITIAIAEFELILIPIILLFMFILNSQKKTKKISKKQRKPENPGGRGKLLWDKVR